VSGIAPAAAYALGLISALLLFASILLHELGHAVVARQRGVAIEGIDLWLLGGVSKPRGSPHGPATRCELAMERVRRALQGGPFTAGEGRWES
jgi:Zn-dependent protease